MAETAQPNELFRRFTEKNRETTVRLLFQMIAKSAAEKHFDRAEALREKLIEVDPMALTEIVQSAEIIEEQKRSSINKDFVVRWSELFSKFSAEETTKFYFLLKDRTYQADEVLLNVGERNNCLFFINRGRLLVSFKQGARETALKVFEEGEVAGADTFFSDTLCTTTLSAFSQSLVSVLVQNDLNKCATQFPALANKLHGFCERFSGISTLVKAKKLERRQFRRFAVSGHAQVQLLDHSGNPIGNAFRGDLADISRGGLAFFVHLSKKENAHLLLGRRLQIASRVPLANEQHAIEKNGTIVAVCPHPFEDYSVHVRFDAIIPDPFP